MLYKKQMSLEKRQNQPLNGPGNYRVIDNIVYTNAIEVNAVRQCNLSCRACSHSSPLAKRQIMDIEQIKSDLNILSRFLHCETVRVVGGEPLLHPEFKDLINVIKESKISNKICLVTNGTLLHTINDSDLINIDKIEISLYPLEKSIVERITNIADKLCKTGKKIRLLKYSFFRESISQGASCDKNVIKDIYETCQIAHFWRCLTVDNERLYRCPQSMIYCENDNDYSDSIEINKIKKVSDLLEFLESNKPLKSCEKCLGSVGKSFEHEQIDRNGWLKKNPQKPEDAIDNIYLQELKINVRKNSKCMSRNRLN